MGGFLNLSNLFSKENFKDPSFLLLIVSNLLVAVFAILGQLSLVGIIVVYCVQTVIILFFDYLKLAWNILHPSPPKDYTGPKPTIIGQSVILIFISFIYFFVCGVFLFVVMLFSIGVALILSPFQIVPSGALAGHVISMLVLFGSFFISHLVSFLYFDKTVKNIQEIKNYFISIFIRAGPLQFFIFIAIIFYIFNLPVLAVLVFVCLKTIADLKLHVLKHSVSVKKA